MRSIPFVSVLALTAGCSDTYNYVTNNNYYEVVEDSDSEDTGTPVDTDVVDSDIVDTDVIDTDLGDCEFLVSTLDQYDMVLLDTLGNELSAIKAASSPSGASVKGPQEMLRITLNSLHTGCPELTLTDLQVEVSASDNAGTGWLQNSLAPSGAWAYSVTSDGTSAATFNWTEAESIGTDSILFTLAGEVVIPTESSVTLKFYADSSGASSVQDDRAQMDLVANSMVVSDGEKTVRLHDYWIPGNSLVY